MVTKKNQAGLWVLAFDIHWPKVHKPSLLAMMDFMKKNPVRGFIFGGDMQDNSEISHHNVRRIIFREPGAYARNTEGFEKNVLNPIEALLPKYATRVWIGGNHDGPGGWERQLVEENPELEGSIERDKLYKLVERGWTVIEMGKGFNLGKALVLHGEAIGSANHAKKAVENYAQSVFYGHHHTIQSHTKVLPQNQNDKWIGQSFPALCATNPVYTRNAPNSWVNGFGIVELDDKGNFNAYPVVVSNGSFRYGGRNYGIQLKGKK